MWKTATIKQSSNPKNWRGLAHVLDLMNESDKSKTAQSHAERIESKVIADKTGRKMEDILADLLDDGILNFSAGSDAGMDSNVQIIPVADDLTRLPGIGKVSAQKLSDAGITTFEQVSKVENSRIMEIINAKKLDNWSELAKKLQEER